METVIFVTMQLPRKSNPATMTRRKHHSRPQAYGSHPHEIKQLGSSGSTSGEWSTPQWNRQHQDNVIEVLEDKLESFLTTKLRKLEPNHLKTGC
jgi:hypothetical protein